MNRRSFLSWLAVAPLGLPAATREALAVPFATQGSSGPDLSEMLEAVTQALSCGMTTARWNGMTVMFPTISAMSEIRMRLLHDGRSLSEALA